MRYLVFTNTHSNSSDVSSNVSRPYIQIKRIDDNFILAPQRVFIGTLLLSFASDMDVYRKSLFLDVIWGPRENTLFDGLVQKH